MRSKTKYVLLILLVLIVSCKDDDHHNHHNHNDGEIKINIIDPLNHSTFNDGDTMNIKVEFSTEDEHGLHDVYVKIIELNTEKEIFKLKKHAHSKEYVIDTFHVVEVNEATDWNFIAGAEDHHHKESKLEYHLHIDK